MDAPIRIVLVLVDPSRYSHDALSFADELASPRGARLLLASVAPAAEQVPQVRESLEEARRELGRPEVELAVRVGDPLREIIHLARSRACDLIVMGSDGTGVTPLTRRVLRRADCPVVTVRGRERMSGPVRLPPEERTGHILVPVDLSAVCELALRHAGWLAARGGTTVELLHVLDWQYDGGSPMNPLDVEQPPHHRIEEAENRLRAAAAALGRVPLEVTVARGSRVRAILAVADARPTDLIVMGTHGRKGLRRVLNPSIAEAVVSRASCPVMTVRLQPAPDPQPGIVVK